MAKHTVEANGVTLTVDLPTLTGTPEDIQKAEDKRLWLLVKYGCCSTADSPSARRWSQEYVVRLVEENADAAWWCAQ